MRILKIRELTGKFSSYRYACTGYIQVGEFLTDRVYNSKMLQIFHYMIKY